MSPDVPAYRSDVEESLRLRSHRPLLDELEFLATVEHALIVEYLSIYCALGEGIPPDGRRPGHVEAAADVARGLATREMRHFHQVNAVLVAAGRSPQVGRASSIDHLGSTITLGPPTGDELERLPAREQAIAMAVDDRYTQICDAIADLDPLFACPTHAEPLRDLIAELRDVAPADLPRVRRHEPANVIEQTLLKVSNEHYRLIVTTLGASFAHEDQLGELLNRALTTMDVLEAVNHLLVARGLLPAFALQRPAN